MRQHSPLQAVSAFRHEERSNTRLDVGEDVENCVLRLLQASDYDVSRAEYVPHITLDPSNHLKGRHHSY